MLPVYICDDELNIRNAIRSALEKRILVEGYDMSIAACTHDPEEILAQVKENPSQGIYFLDVELKGESMDGFALGQAIRGLDPRGFLIYVTSFRELAFMTFQYHLEALDYIVKDVPEKMFESIGQCLDIITRRMGEQHVRDGQDYFTLKVMDMVKHIPLKDILFFETHG